MKKKAVTKKKKPSKSEQIIKAETLISLERRILELTRRIEMLEAAQYYRQNYPQPKYWPNIPNTPIWTYQ